MREICQSELMIMCMLLIYWIGQNFWGTTCNELYLGFVLLNKVIYLSEFEETLLKLQTNQPFIVPLKAMVEAVETINAIAKMTLKGGVIVDKVAYLPSL